MAKKMEKVYGSRLPKGPRFETASLTSRPARRIIALLICAFAGVWGVARCFNDNAIGVGHYGAKFVNWDHRRNAVRNAFETSWQAYSENAWGTVLLRYLCQKCLLT